MSGVGCREPLDGDEVKGHWSAGLRRSRRGLWKGSLLLAEAEVRSSVRRVGEQYLTRQGRRSLREDDDTPPGFDGDSGDCAVAFVDDLAAITEGLVDMPVTHVAHHRKHNRCVVFQAEGMAAADEDLAVALYGDGAELTSPVEDGPVIAQPRFQMPIRQVPHEGTRIPLLGVYLPP